jgi:acetyl-CoA acetyltransferase
VGAEVFLVDGVRTAQGRYVGALAQVRPDDLAALCVGVGQGVAVLIEAL